MKTIFLTQNQYKKFKQAISTIDCFTGDTIEISTEIEVVDDNEKNVVSGEHFKIEIISPFKLLTKLINHE